MEIKEKSDADTLKWNRREIFCCKKSNCVLSASITVRTPLTNTTFAKVEHKQQ